MTTTKSATSQAAVTEPQATINLSSTTEHIASESSAHVINRDCYMVVANDADSDTAILDLDMIALDDVMMTDEHEVIDDQLLT